MTLSPPKVDAAVAHTSGPWDAWGCRVCEAAETKTVAVAELMHPTDNSDGIAETLANARLIAAAPDLLEALEACLPVVGRYESEHGSNWALDAHIKATAAISKARGQ